MDAVQIFKQAQSTFESSRDPLDFGRVDRAVLLVQMDLLNTQVPEIRCMNQMNAAIRQITLVRNQEIIVSAST